MTLTRLLRRTLVFHRRANLALLLGVAVGTAVLTGALLVGDSLRGSLRGRALRQLAWVDAALVGPRLVGQGLADRLSSKRVVPALILQGNARRADVSDPAGEPVSRVTVIGMTLADQGRFYQEAAREAGIAPGQGILMEHMIWGGLDESVM